MSHYAGFEKKIAGGWGLRAHGVHDAISGASPSGDLGGEEGEVPLSALEDTRRAGVVDLDWERGIHKTSLQYAHSKESDYLSRGYALYNTSEYRKRNTGLNYGISYVDDEIEPGFFSAARSKRSVDYYAGVTQVLDTNTVARFNLTYGEIDGYLNDPYKIIRKETEILPGLSLPLTYPENRPAERTRRIVSTGVKRYFPAAKGSLDLGYRYFRDSWSIDSGTIEVEWSQKIGESFVLRPGYRYYRQSGASFYYPSLNGLDIDPEGASAESGPHFSADYRLARLAAETWGMKLVYNYKDALRFDVSWARYAMEGRDPAAPAAAFPSADILTLGGSWWF